MVNAYYPVQAALRDAEDGAKGVVEMQNTIRQTIFQVEQLKNIVGVGSTSAYQIVVTPGTNLGTLGIVTVPAHAEICNEPVFAPNSANESSRSLIASWFHRALATLHALKVIRTHE
jgi:hypothetical protein